MDTMKNGGNLLAMAWNLHAQGGYGRHSTPDWVVTEIVRYGADVAILTEFSPAAQEKDRIARLLEEYGYDCAVSGNQQGNEVMIAVKRDHPIVYVAWVPCYGKDRIPENLRVDILVNGKELVTILGVRIKEVKSDNHEALRRANRVDVAQAQARLAEAQALVNWTGDLEQPVLIGGDFNTFRDGTCVVDWNGEVLQKLIVKAGFEMVCPEQGSSMGFEHSDYDYRYDRFLVRKLSRITEPCYDRNFVAHAPHVYRCGRDFKDILPGFPDHAILKVELRLN